jgi:hypothetical protein
MHTEGERGSHSFPINLGAASKNKESEKQKIDNERKDFIRHPWAIH